MTFNSSLVCNINKTFFILYVVCMMTMFRGGRIPSESGGVSAVNLQSDIDDLEAKENMLDALITNAGMLRNCILAICLISIFSFFYLFIIIWNS